MFTNLNFHLIISDDMNTIANIANAVFSISNDGVSKEDVLSLQYIFEMAYYNAIADNYERHLEI